ncbi:ribonuclease D [Thalassoglobus sp.]|uniref:ribonuclease D n=1 Tax=Thalassoglobus sp. TaxID=2795869 RepID=UPI003AA80639
MTLITRQSDFDQLCEKIEQAGIVAFDTEFSSESYYRPRLCLLQFAFDDVIAGVDPFEVTDLSMWWEIMADDKTTVVIHGGREEVRFCQFAIHKRPRKLLDVQIAEGLRSRGFPISHTNLVNRVLNTSVKHGKETRTDWERRPLAEKQIQYALEDVHHLIEIWETQQQSLNELNRLSWAEAEFERFVEDVFAEEQREGWLRLSGFSRLSRRDMATAKALFQWRDQIAFEKNKPPRRVLRDDLLIDVAKRQPKTLKDLNMVRDMNRRDYQQHAEEILSVIKQAIQIAEEDLPPKQKGKQYPSQDEVLARILGLALANRCQELGISMPLVGTTSDLKELVRWHVFDNQRGKTPKLLEGWRGEVCGKILTDVLDGNVSLRVVDPRSENPLSFDVDRTAS